MMYPVVILTSVMVLIALIIVKVPLMHYYKKFRREIWHRWIIWKIDRNLHKTSLDNKRPFKLNFDVGD